MNKILIIGPFPDPISGVSLANITVKKVLDNSNCFSTSIINTSYPIFQDEVGKFSIKKMFFFIRINLKVFQVFKNDIVYITPGQTFYGVFKYALFILLASLFKKELVIHVHGNYLGKQYKLLNGFKKKYFYFLLTKFNKGIVLSSSLKSNLTPFLKKENIYVLYNFAEEYLYKNKLHKDFSHLKITYLSNLMEEKGILYVLEALEKLEKNNIHYKAKIAGNIDEKLKDIVLKSVNNLKNVSYVGVVYKKEKKELLHWSNVFVLPTFYKMEGQPISILEAMATENVILTTSHAGISDIIEDKIHGYIVEPKSAESIFKALIFLNENKSKILEISKKNKMYFANNFTVQKFSENILRILNTNAKTKYI